MNNRVLIGCIGIFLFLANGIYAILGYLEIVQINMLVTIITLLISLLIVSVQLLRPDEEDETTTTTVTPTINNDDENKV